MARACAEIKILSEFSEEKVTYAFKAFRFFNFAFPFLLAAVIDLLLGLLAVKKLLKKHHRGGQFLPRRDRCSGRKFASEFFTQLFEHFSLHISGSIRPITLIWAPFERFILPAEVEYR